MPKTAQIELYKSPQSKPSQRFWWRVRAANGKVLADSGEGYSRPSKARRAALLLSKTFATLPIVEVEK